ncbi:MAG: apolipoprotein N-acyltransferase [Cyanobacteriota bacterium]|nr:apolipoprotein N-acyltransferase [Cyanobacteriota bacterium]
MPTSTRASILLSPIALAVFGGALMGLTVAPFGLWVLAWVAIVPLWVLLGQPRSVASTLRISFAWGIGYYALALFWITGVHPMTWMGVPWLASLAIALFCWIFITLTGTLLVLVWGLCMSWLHTKTQKPISRILLGTALWCVLEHLWSATPLWWPWLGLTQSPHNLIILHLGQLSGPITVAAAIVAVNGCLGEAWLAGRGSDSPKNSASRYLAMAAVLLVGCHGLGFWLFDRPLASSPETALNVGIIQGNIPNEIKLYPGGIRRALEGYVRGYQTLADEGVEVILTPETALPVLWAQVDGLGRDTPANHLYQAILERGVPIWVGGFGEQDGDLTNSLFSVGGNGDTLSRYDKIKLVPLGEYIPFEEALGKIIGRLSPLDARLVAGKPDQIFETPFGRAIAAICYESAFPQTFQRQAAAGGEFILSAANNAHYAESMPAQHHAQDVMRAIETDRWAVRATNTGYSAIVDPHGRTQWISGINTYEVHADTIYRRETRTPYTRWGNFIWIFAQLAIIIVGIIDPPIRKSE